MSWKCVTLEICFFLSPIPRNSYLYSRRLKSIVPIHSTGVCVSCSKNEHYAHSKLYLHQNRRNALSFYLISNEGCPDFLRQYLTPLVWNILFVQMVLRMRKESGKSALRLFVLQRALNNFQK